ncbi:hypothetical protein [Olsenella intestinalis]|uniref:hypothetical protein n=1 Tax=Olsenella intestinalis TaxID=2930083 RepID=UPI00200EAA97|nr:hypothetical protein [Olsenella intestinalis]
MSSEAISSVADAFLASSMPIDPNTTDQAAERAISFYRTAPAAISLPEEEVAERFSEMWDLWFAEGGTPSKELRDAVREAVGVDANMKRLAGEYFRLVEKLEQKFYMSRAHAVALVGCAPLIRTLVVEQHLGLDRIRSILNVPGATFDAIRSVLGAIGISAAFVVDNIDAIHQADTEDVSAYFGDTPADESDGTFKGLLGNFSRNEELWEEVTELVRVGFEPYLFMLYFELLTLDTTDRFPGRAIYECGPRGQKVQALWNSMYHPTQANPYLNNAKSVYSLDTAWAETKLSHETQNGSIMLADIFDIMSELPYTTRRRVAHVIRCYLVHEANEKQASTPLPSITPAGIRSFVERVATSNSRTKGVLDQRLVDFLTMCSHDYDKWGARGLGSSVNETNTSGRKFGDVEYLSLEDRRTLHAYEAHGGGLRDEYVQDHINSLVQTVDYFKRDAKDRGEEFMRNVEVAYVAHDISRLSRFKDGHAETIGDIPFTFRFMTFYDLLEEAGGIDSVSMQTELFDELVHHRISRLPDAYSLKERYALMLDTARS